MNRTQTVLSMILLVQVALLVALQWRGDEEAAELGDHPLLPAFQELEPRKIVLGPTADNEQLTLVLEDRVWRIEEAGGYPADAQKVTDLLAELKTLQVRRPVVTSSKYHETLELTEDDSGGRIRVWGTDSTDPAIDLLLGTSATYQSVHVRLEGEDAVFEAKGIAPYDFRPDARAWIETKLLPDVETADVTTIRVENDAGSIELAKSSEGWKLVSAEGADVDGENVETWVRSMLNLTIDEPVGPIDRDAHGFADPAATVTVTAEGENPVTTTILFGTLTDAESDKRFVTREGFGFTAAAWKSATDSVTNATASDFLSGDS